jgi:hypothetical protein
MIAPDPWVSAIAAFEPEYYKLKDAVEKAPKIRLVLRKVNLAWRIRIEEDWDHVDADEQYLYYTADYGNLDTRCEWAATQLKDWQLVNRLSHQEWKFWKRKDADKFLTIFNLKWACQ